MLNLKPNQLTRTRAWIGLVSATLFALTVAPQPVLSQGVFPDPMFIVEKFSLRGVIPTATDDGAGNSGANPAVTVPVIRSSSVVSGASITFKLGNGVGTFPLPYGPTSPSIFDNSSPSFPGGGFCATKYGSATFTMPDQYMINRHERVDSSIVMTLSGIGCSDGITGLDGLTWIITGGTGRFVGAVGAGRMSYAWGPATGTAAAASILDLDGTIRVRLNLGQ